MRRHWWLLTLHRFSPITTAQSLAGSSRPQSSWPPGVSGKCFGNKPREWLAHIWIQMNSQLPETWVKAHLELPSRAKSFWLNGNYPFKIEMFFRVIEEKKRFKRSLDFNLFIEIFMNSWFIQIEWNEIFLDFLGKCYCPCTCILRVTSSRYLCVQSLKNIIWLWDSHHNVFHGRVLLQQMPCISQPMVANMPNHFYNKTSTSAISTVFFLFNFTDDRVVLHIQILLRCESLSSIF